MPQKPLCSGSFYWNFDSSCFKGTLLIYLFQLTLGQPSEGSPSCHSKNHTIVFGFQCKIKDFPKSCIQTMYFKEQQFCDVSIFVYLVIKFPVLMTEEMASGCRAHIFRKAANQVEDFAVWLSKYRQITWLVSKYSSLVPIWEGNIYINQETKMN